MKKEKLVAILTGDGKFDSIMVAARASTGEVELALSEIYSLNDIQWMEIRKVSMQSLKTLNKAFGRRLTTRA